MKPKHAPAEAQRQQRLISLYNWGRMVKMEDDVMEQVLSQRALEMFGVSTYTANNYAKIVAWRLRKEAVKV